MPCLHHVLMNLTRRSILMVPLAAATAVPEARPTKPALDLRAEAQEPADSASDQAVARLKAMGSLARSIKVSKVVDQKSNTPVALRAEPLLRYNDPPRGIHDATLWAWGQRGRPRAVLKVENYPTNDPARRWVFGLVSLAPYRIAVEFHDGKEWKPLVDPALERHVVTRQPPAPGGVRNKHSVSSRCGNSRAGSRGERKRGSCPRSTPAPG